MSDEYEIGHGKPPKHTRFKKGQSGNPEGRPKRKSLIEDVLNELNAIITIIENGEKIKTTRQNAMVKGLVAKSLSVDFKAISLLMRIIAQNKSVEPETLPVFKLAMGNPKVEKSARLAQIEKESAEIRKELGISKENHDG